MARHENSVTALPECPLLSQFLRGIEAYGDELGLVARDVKSRPVVGGEHGVFPVLVALIVSSLSRPESPEGTNRAARRGLCESRRRAMAARTAQPFRPQLPGRKLSDRFQNPTVAGRAKRGGIAPKCAVFDPGPITSCRSLVNRAWGQCASQCSGLDLREVFRVRGLWPPPLKDSGRRLNGAQTARHRLETDDSDVVQGTNLGRQFLFGA